MAASIIVTALAVFLIGGHLLQLLFDRDDWPFCAYPMYGHLVSDKAKNPYIPLREEHDDYETGFIVLTVVLADGSSEVLTTKFAHPLVKPFDRLRIVRQLTEKYSKRLDLRESAQNFADWIQYKNAKAADPYSLKAVEVRLFLWNQIPDKPDRNHPPDESVLLEIVELNL